MCLPQRALSLLLQGRMTHELASTTKAWTTLRGREVVSLGRELLGGNGIVSDFLVRRLHGFVFPVFFRFFRVGFQGFWRKTWTKLLSRKVTALGAELLGGSGIPATSSCVGRFMQRLPPMIKA
jgi:hypothetical protein